MAPVQDSRLTISNEEAGRRYAREVFAGGARQVRFFVFEGLDAPACQLRASLASLQATFGPNAHQAAVVAASRADVVPDSQRKGQRLQKTRDIMTKCGLDASRLVCWQHFGSLSSGAQHAQLKELQAALGRVDAVAPAQLQSLWQRQQARAQHFPVPTKEMILLMGPAQSGKTTFLNDLMLPTEGAPLPVGDGSGESCTDEVALRQTLIGLLMDRPGYDNSKSRLTDHEAGRLYAESSKGSCLKVLVFDGQDSPCCRLRSSLTMLQSAVGPASLLSAVVVASRVDLVPDAQRAKRLQKIREIMTECGLDTVRLVCWQHFGSLSSAAQQAQIDRLQAALANVPTWCETMNDLELLGEDKCDGAKLLRNMECARMCEVRRRRERGGRVRRGRGAANHGFTSSELGRWVRAGTLAWVHLERNSV